MLQCIYLGCSQYLCLVEIGVFLGGQICFFGQFSSETYRLATIHVLKTTETDRVADTTLYYERNC